MQKEFRFLELSEEDYVSGIRSLAKEFRVAKSGGKLDFVIVLQKIMRAVRMIGKKIRKGKSLYEHEKWLFDNSYLIKRAAERYTLKVADLPSKDGELRGVTLMRYALSNKKSFSESSLLFVLQEASRETHFLYEELQTIENAAAYALCEGLSVVAERILYHDRMKRLASDGSVDERYFYSDIYNYFLLKNSVEPEKLKIKLSDFGVNPLSAETAYTMVTIENDELAKRYVMLLGKVSEWASFEKLAKCSDAYQKLTVIKHFDRMSADTQMEYFRFVAEAAQKAKTSESYAAEKLTQCTKKYQLDIEEFVFHGGKTFLHYLKTGKLKRHSINNNTLRVVLYFGLSFLTSAVITALAVWLMSSFTALLLWIPLNFAINQAINLYLRNIVKRKFLPKMDYVSVPSSAKTTVVVSEFITSCSQLQEAIKNLRVLRAGNGGENVEFALLIDLKAADSEIIEEDSQILDFLNTKLKNETGLNAFIRKRCFSGVRYCGRERKRGAIEDLNLMLSTGNTDAFCLVLNPPQTPKYIVLLDSDNAVEPGGILEMVNLIAHPANERFDLLTAAGKYRLHSIKTAYAARFRDAAGLEQYPHYSSFFYDLFGEDIFCGKGIYRLKSYEKKLSDIFPEQKILSHDILEGAVLNTASGGVVYEDAPETFVQDEIRAARWDRGDIQLLPFIFRGWKNNKGERYRSEISLFYRLLILQNALRVVCPVALFTAVVVGLFMLPSLAVMALAVSIIPLLVTLCSEVNAICSGKKIRFFIKDIAKQMYCCLEDFLLLPYRAVKKAALLISTLIRMAKGKNLLEWKTFYSTRGKAAATDAVKLSVPMLILAVPICILFAFLRPEGLILYAIWVALSVATLGILCVLSTIVCSEFKVADKNKTFLSEIAKRTYQYFDFVKDKSNLIADNFQERPYKGLSNTTSPTNLGFALLAEICGFYLGYKSLEETLEEIKIQLSKIEKLKKWRGNLYNWYHLDGRIVEQFVSSVDSGNFLVALTVLKSFLKEVDEVEILSRTEKLIEQTDINSLYDKQKKLLYLGYDVKSRKYSGHYDILMSEARLSAVMCIAKNQDSALWRNLARDYGGNTFSETLLSWSGTAFEYLMPALFLQTPKSSLIYVAEKNAVKIQSKTKLNGVWGRSECGYYRFDQQMKYQYYAVGDDKLSLRGETNLPVVAPYASILALRYSSRKTIKNLRRLQKYGAYGGLGFYESIDFTNDKKIVESYMTHHQGMALVALTNSIKGNVIAKLFQSIDQISAVEILLAEKQDVFRKKLKTKKNQSKTTKNAVEYYENTDKVEYYKKFFGLSNGKVSVGFDSLGNNETRVGQVLTGKPYQAQVSTESDGFMEVSRVSGSFFYTKGKQLWHTATLAPYVEKEQRGSNFNFCAGQTGNKIFFENRSANVFLDVWKNDNFEAVVQRFRVKAGTGKQVKIAFIKELTINTEEGYLSHPTFNGMFVETEYLSEKKTLIAKRKSTNGVKERYVALVVRGMQNMNVITDREKCVGRGRTLKNPLILEEAFQSKNNETTVDENLNKNGTFELDRATDAEFDLCKKTKIDAKSIVEHCDVGEVLEPAFAFCGWSEFASDGYATIETAEICAESREELMKKLDTLPSDFVEYTEKSYSENFFADAFVSKLTSNLILSARDISFFAKLNDCDNSFFRKINGNGKGVVYLAQENAEPLKMLIRALRVAGYFGCKTRLCVCIKNAEDIKFRYFIEKTLKESFLEDWLLITEQDEVLRARQYAFMTLDERLIVPEVLFRQSALGNVRKESECAQPIIADNLVLSDKNGGFFENGDFLLTGCASMPFSNVVALQEGGFIATENGGGFGYFGNSRENKINYYENDPISDQPTEYIFIGSKQFYRINAGASATRYAPGKITYYGQFNQFSYRTECYMLRNGKVRVWEVEYQSMKDKCELIYGFLPALDWKRNPDDISFYKQNGCLLVQNLKNGNEIYVRLLKNKSSDNDLELFSSVDIAAGFRADLNEKEGTFFIAISNSKTEILSLNVDDICGQKAETIRYFNSLNPITIKTKDLPTDILVNRWLLAQTVSSRLNARAGFYQVGGAVGFRDQLQDVLALLSSNTERVKEQILQSAAHQYQEGDVQHWWHPPKFGNRTKISDDKLFLVLVTAKYLQATGDTAILKTEIPYLSSTPLSEHETSRLESPHTTKETESLLKHCFRALKSAMRYGEHDLLLMGTGDWNDGMDEIGKEMRGESVVTSMLFVWAVKEFLKFVEDSAIRVELGSIAERLKSSLNRHAYQNGRYARLFSDDGKWYGVGGALLSVDLVSESLAVLSGVADLTRGNSSLSAASELVDKKLRVIRLLTPSLDKNCNLGYISSYPKGVRENGGQYTHAAIWYLWALAEVGQQNEAYRLFKMINPVEKFCVKEVYDKYKAEPFVLSGDVYTSKRNPGRAGWSWYTGSAAWCYTFITECLLGIKRKGEDLEILPKFPEELNGAEAVYRYKNSEYRIKYEIGSETALYYQGIKLTGQFKIPLKENKREEIIIQFSPSDNCGKN